MKTREPGLTAGSSSGMSARPNVEKARELRLRVFAHLSYQPDPRLDWPALDGILEAALDEAEDRAQANDNAACGHNAYWTGRQGCMVCRAEAAEARVRDLEAAIREHHDQKADDRCIDDDTRLYAAAGLPQADHRVGDRAAMLENCARFITRRCEGGGWPSYRQLEDAARAAVASLSHDWPTLEVRALMELLEEGR